MQTSLHLAQTVRLLCAPPRSLGVAVKLMLGLLVAATATAQAKDTVIVLHGLGRTPLSMSRVAHDLRDQGYTVQNLAYPSQRDDIRTLADATLGPIFAGAPVDARIHIVTHSLGGILVRQYLHDHGTPASLGRVVMIAPPNSGSAIVDRLRGWKIYQHVNGPAGLQLGTDADATPLTLGPAPASVQIGVIAGDRTLNPLFSSWLEGKDDGKVTVPSTHLAGETDHITVPYSHTWLMWRRPVLNEISTFLKTGFFSAGHTT
ncbi:MAG: alpha/beta fold hydrolase [Rariglobus sp.]